MSKGERKTKELLDNVPKTPDQVLEKAQPVEDEDPVLGLKVKVPKFFKDVKDTIED